MAFIDLTKAFDVVNMDCLFEFIMKIGCPPTLLSIIKSFHQGMQATVKFYETVSGPFDVESGTNQGDVLASILFGIYFAVVLICAFGPNLEEGMLLHCRFTGKLYNPARLRAKTKIFKVLLREFLHADDAGISSYSPSGLQPLIDIKFSRACEEFGLTISVKKTEILQLRTSESHNFIVSNYTLEVVNKFTYLGSIVTSNNSLASELNVRISNASTTMGKLSQRVWENKKVNIAVKIKVYSVCVISIMLYGAEYWATYARQERKLNVFHLRCLRTIL